MIRLGSAVLPEQKPDWSLSSLGANFAAGYLEGLTTHDILGTESPDTSEEYIARSLGSVLGFIGFIPVPGSGALTKIGFASMGRTMQLLGNAERAASYLARANEIRMMTFSVPSAFGKLGAAGVERFFESSAARATMEFAERTVGRELLSQSTKEMTRHLISQAAFMGFASGAAAVPISFNPLSYFSEEDFKRRSGAFLEGIPYGLAQGVIANAITQKTLGKIGFSSLADMPQEKRDFLLKSFRAVSTGIAMAGYTAYKQDVPIEYTIYEGLLNGVFGWREMPYGMKEASRLVGKHIKTQYDVHGDLIGKSGEDIVRFMESHGETPSEATKAELRLIYEHHWGQSFATGFLSDLEKDLASETLGISKNDINQMPDSELAALLKKPELEQLKLLRVEYGKKLFDDDFAAQSKEFTEREGRAPDEVEANTMTQAAYLRVQQQVGEENGKLVEWVKKTASRVEFALDGNKTFIEKQDAINASLKESGVSRRQMFQVLDVLGPQVLVGRDELEVVSGIGKIFYDHRSKNIRTYGPVKEKLESFIKQPMTEDQNAQMRALWNLYSHSILSDERIYDIGLNQLVERPQYGRDGLQRSIHRTLYSYEEEFDTRLTTVPEAEGRIGRNDIRETIGIYEGWKKYENGKLVEQSVNLNKLVQSAYSQGLVLVGNRKDDYQMLFDKRSITYNRETNEYSFIHKGKEYGVHLERAFNQIDQAEGKTGSWEAFVADRMKYVEDNLEKPYAELSQVEKVSYEDAFNEIAADRMLKWMALNRKNNLYDIFASPGSTIRGAFSYTTRLQVLGSAGIPLDPTVVGKEHYKTILVDTRSGELKNVLGEYESTHKDGVTMFLSHVLKDLASAIGVKLTHGFFKTAAASPLETGLVLMKHGQHLASSANEYALKEALGDIDMVSFAGTATKQPGDIPVVYLDYTPEGKYVVTDATGTILSKAEIEMVKFNMPVSSLRINPSVTDDSAMQKIHLIKQMISNVPEIRDHLFNTFVQRGFNGTEEANKRFAELKTGEEIDLDKVGLKQIIETLYGPEFHKNTPQLHAVIDKLMKYELDKGDNIDGDGESDVIRDLEKLRTSVSLSIQATGRKNITPGFLRRPDIRDYMEQVLWHYMSDRIQRPIWDGFGGNQKISYGLSPVDLANFKSEHGRDFQQGDFLLGVENRKMLRGVPEELRELFPGRDKITLGELWDYYQKNPKNELLSDYFSRTIAVRSPQSDASGSRKMRFMGFSGPGFGVTVHDLDMKYLDGADLDGDAIKFYMGFDKTFVEHIDQPHIKHRFSRFFSSLEDRDAFARASNAKSEGRSYVEGDLHRGYTIKQVLNDPKLTTILSTGRDAEGKVYLEEFAMEKGHNPHLKGNQDNTNLKRTYSMFSPSLLAEAGRQATTGKHNLGWGLAAANRGRELGHYLRSLSGRKLEIADGEYYLKAKADPEEFNRTVWDIVNSCADATKGKNPPVDPTTMRVVGGVLSVADVYDERGNLVSPQEFIDFIKTKGMNKIPILKELTRVDSALKLRDYNGEKRHLQDAFYDLRQKIASAQHVSGMDNLGSVWYRSAQLLSTLNYEPTPGDFTNMATSDMVRRAMDRFIKSEDPVARFLLRALGRTGLSFNNSYVTQTDIWREVIAAYKGPMTENQLLADFISQSDYRNSEAWKLSAHLPDIKRGEFTNKQDLFQGQLVATSMKYLKEGARYDPDKRSIRYTTSRGVEKIEYFNSEQEAKEWVNEQIAGGSQLQYSEPQKILRTKGAQTKYVEELWQNDFTDMTSLLFMHDYLSKYVETRLSKENLTPENINKLLEEEIRPFSEQISGMKGYAINSQKSIANPLSDTDPETGRRMWKTPQQKKEAFRSWEEALREAEEFRAHLPNEKKILFDALWLSSIHFNEFVDPIGEPAVDMVDAQTKANKRKTEIDSRPLKTYRGRVGLISDIADPAMVKEYFKRFATLQDVMAEGSEKFSIDRVADRMNISELTNNYARFMMESPEFAAINQHEIIESATRKFVAPIKQVSLQDYKKDYLGNIRDVRERLRYDELKSRLRRLFKDMPEELENFRLRYPQVMAEIYGTEFSWSPEYATYADMKLYADYLQGRVFDPNEVPKVKQNFFMMKFGTIARATQNYQKVVDKFKVVFGRPVLTSEGPTTKEPVMAILSHYDIIHRAAQAMGTENNAIESMAVKLYNTAHPYGETLDKAYDGLYSKITGMAAATIELPLSYQVSKKAEKNLYRENYIKMQKLYDTLPNGPYAVIDAQGKTVSYTKGEILQRNINGWRTFQNELSSLLHDRPHDTFLVRTGKFFGRNRIEEIDVEKTISNILHYTLQINGRQPDMSLHAKMELAAWMALDGKAFDVYTTPQEIVFDSKTGTKWQEHFDRALAEARTGYTLQRGKLFKNMTLAEQNAVMDILYPNGDIEGFSIADRMDTLNENYWHHFTPNPKTVTEYLRTRLGKMMENLPNEELKNMSGRLIREVLRATHQEDYNTAGQEIAARLFDKGDPVKTLHFHPSSILGDRSIDDPIPGWSLGPDAMFSAYRKLLKVNHDMLFAITGKYVVDNARKNKVFGEGIDGQHIANFGERFVRQVLGFQDVTPPEFGDGYNYGLKTNWFKFHNDSWWAKKITEIGDTWFGGKIFPEYQQLASIAAQIKFQDDNERKRWIEQCKNNLSQKKITWLTQNEAKWSLMSLLTSLKTAVTNIASAEIMTYINAGHDAYVRSFRLQDIQSEFGKDVIKNPGDVQSILEMMGGLESQYVNEWGLDPSTPKAVHRAITDVIKEATDKKWSEAQITQKLRESGLWDTVVQKAGWFMKKSERVARSHSMLAHYINARRTFRQAGFELEYNDPWIMQIAREGVKASQFLYSNTERPAFMASAMGKIFHRFQLFAYNSTEFRYNVARAAQRTGIAAGSADYQKFNRMMAADLFVFGMASLVPYSVFGNSLMAPYNGLLNMSQYIFGTDEEKKRSFYSPLPYPANIVQPVVPPGLREIPQLFGLFCSEGNTVKLLGDAVATWMPFQRIAKDIGKSVANPTMVIDNMTGIPFLQIPQIEKRRLGMSSFQDYISRYRDRAPLSNSKKIEKDIHSYIEQYPSP